MTVEWPSLSRDQHGYEEFVSGMTINLIIQLFVGAIDDNVVGAIGEVDAVLLVDSAAQPMQAAPVAAMRELARSGNAAKLIVVFTHFDEVKGDNPPTLSAKGPRCSYTRLDPAR
jgi:hypothetical protein